jgi:hypothetical protein
MTRRSLLAYAISVMLATPQIARAWIRGSPPAEVFIDDLGVTSWADDLGVTSPNWIDDNGVTG